jgi:hypothetical protein
VLSLGGREPRRPRWPRWPGSSSRLFSRLCGAAVCLALGALGGVQIDDALDARRAGQERDDAPPELSAGVIQEYPDPDSGLLFAVPVFNGGSSEVSVESVSAEAWVARDARFRTVTILPQRWAMVPLPLQIDCDAIGAAAPESLTVRASTANGTFEQSLKMPVPSRVLGDEGWRLCLDPRGSSPTARDLYGSWFVEEAGRFRRTVVRLREGGTFAIDPDVFAFGADLNAVGTFTRSGSGLRLTAGGGRDCRPGDRTTWILTLLDDGRLHIRHRSSGASWCRIDDGEVWVARRITGPSPTRTAD